MMKGRSGTRETGKLNQVLVNSVCWITIKRQELKSDGECHPFGGWICHSFSRRSLMRFVFHVEHGILRVEVEVSWFPSDCGSRQLGSYRFCDSTAAVSSSCVQSWSVVHSQLLCSREVPTVQTNSGSTVSSFTSAISHRSGKSYSGWTYHVRCCACLSAAWWVRMPDKNSRAEIDKAQQHCGRWKCFSHKIHSLVKQRSWRTTDLPWLALSKIFLQPFSSNQWLAPKAQPRSSPSSMKTTRERSRFGTWSASRRTQWLDFHKKYPFRENTKECH